MGWPLNKVAGYCKQPRRSCSMCLLEHVVKEDRESGCIDQVYRDAGKAGISDWRVRNAWRKFLERAPELGSIKKSIHCSNMLEIINKCL